MKKQFLLTIGLLAVSSTTLFPVAARGVVKKAQLPPPGGDPSGQPTAGLVPTKAQAVAAAQANPAGAAAAIEAAASVIAAGASPDVTVDAYLNGTALPAGASKSSKVMGRLKEEKKQKRA